MEQQFVGALLLSCVDQSIIKFDYHGQNSEYITLHQHAVPDAGFTTLKSLNCILQPCGRAQNRGAGRLSAISIYIRRLYVTVLS